MQVFRAFRFHFTLLPLQPEIQLRCWLFVVTYSLPHKQLWYSVWGFVFVWVLFPKSKIWVEGGRKSSVYLQCLQNDARLGTLFKTEPWALSYFPWCIWLLGSYISISNFVALLLSALFLPLGFFFYLCLWILSSCSNSQFFFILFLLSVLASSSSLPTRFCSAAVTFCSACFSAILEEVDCAKEFSRMHWSFSKWSFVTDIWYERSGYIYMFYFGCMSFFTFPVGGVGNGFNKLRLAVSLCLFYFTCSLSLWQYY